MLDQQRPPIPLRLFCEEATKSSSSRNSANSDLTATYESKVKKPQQGSNSQDVGKTRVKTQTVLKNTKNNEVPPNNVRLLTATADNNYNHKGANFENEADLKRKANPFDASPCSSKAIIGSESRSRSTVFTVSQLIRARTESSLNYKSAQSVMTSQKAISSLPERFASDEQKNATT